MDIVPDPPGTWNFNEVYMYEELMEADLHAIVSGGSDCGRTLLFEKLKAHFQVLLLDSEWSTIIGCSFPIVPVSDAMWIEGEHPS